MLKSKFKNVNVTCPHDCPDTCSLNVSVDTKKDLLLVKKIMQNDNYLKKYSKII